MRASHGALQLSAGCDGSAPSQGACLFASALAHAPAVGTRLCHVEEALKVIVGGRYTCAAACSSAAAAEAKLQSPHGGKLVNLSLDGSAIADAAKSCNKTVQCTDRQACDVELLSVGCALAPACRRAHGAAALPCLCNTLAHRVRTQSPELATQGPCYVMRSCSKLVRVRAVSTVKVRAVQQ